MAKPKLLKSQFLNLTRESLCFVFAVVDNHYQSYYAVKNSKLKRDIEKDFLVLSSTYCDDASSIKIEFNGNTVSSIKRLGEDTEGWEEIRLQTYFSIVERFEQLRNLGISA